MTRMKKRRHHNNKGLRMAKNDRFYHNAEYYNRTYCKGEKMSNKLNPKEALYGFCGWLTTRKEKTAMSASDDAAPIPELIEKFAKVNNLDDVSKDWPDNLVSMKEE